MPKPFGYKNKPPVLMSRRLSRQLAVERAAASAEKLLVRHKINQYEVNYFMQILDALDKSVRPTVNRRAKIGKNSRYTPIQIYETILSYLQLTVAGGHPLTMSGMGLFCGTNHPTFSEYMTDKRKDPNYAFLSKLVGFVEMYMEYTAQNKMNPAFQIFWLKNRGWVDKIEIVPGQTQGALSEDERKVAQERISNFTE